jgi:stage II sporulation protein GA (sporulation sigma-E factor processing peptidase)
MTNFTNRKIYNYINNLSTGGGHLEQIVYLDVIFVENFLINFLLVYIVARYCSLKAKIWRMSISALFGSSYVLIIFTGSSIAFSAFIKILVSFLMIFIAFGFESKKQFFKRVILFYITAFILSGAIIAVFYMTNASFESISGSFVIRDVKYWHLIVGGLCANILVKIAFDYLDNHYRNSKKRIVIKLNLWDKSIRINALLDSGNSLKDPITGKPVIVVYTKAIREILPERYLNLLEKEVSQITQNQPNYELLYQLNSTSLERNCTNKQLNFKMMPYKALGVEDGKLLAFSIDSIEITAKDNSILVKDPMIALYDRPLSANNYYEAIAYPEIIEGVIFNE